MNLKQKNKYGNRNGDDPSFKEWEVRLSNICIHPDVEKNEIHTSSYTMLSDWSDMAIRCELIANPIICILSSEKDSEFLAIKNSLTLKLCKLTLPPHSKITVIVVPNETAAFFLTGEILITPVLCHRKIREIGANYRALKKTYLKNILAEFGPAFSSQDQVSKHLESSRSSVFYPSEKKSKKPQNENNRQPLVGDELPIRELVKSRRKK